MNIAIIGPGSVGLLLAGYLHKTDVNLTLIDHNFTGPVTHYIFTGNKVYGVTSPIILLSYQLFNAFNISLVYHINRPLYKFFSLIRSIYSKKCFLCQ
ncbi:2-dehydropantoate 2-reductase N-terminal domain-containing protein [Spirochaetota bacterium]